MTSYPFSPFPNGWYQIAWSEEIRTGAVRPLRYLGMDLAIFRGDDGSVHVLDAHCPHMGAHLGYGSVTRDRVACPFHGWSFNGEGRCVGVPYAKKIPPRARVATHRIIERDGMVYLWWHAADSEPDYEPPVFAEMTSALFRPMRRENLFVDTNLVELNENLFDTAHFLEIHGYHRPPRVEITWSGPTVSVSHETTASVLGYELDINVRSDLHGPGVQLVYVTSSVEFLVVANKTPIDEHRIHERLSITFRRRVPLFDRALEEVMVRRIVQEASREHRIFETKIFRPQPLLAEGDGPVHQFRRWYRQFDPSAREPTHGGNPPGDGAAR